MDISVQYSFNARKLISAKNVNVIQRGPEITSEKQMTIPHQVRIRNVTSSLFSPVTAIAENGLSALLKLTTRKVLPEIFPALSFSAHKKHTPTTINRSPDKQN